MYIRICIIFQNLFQYNLTRKCVLCCTVGPCYLSYIQQCVCVLVTQLCPTLCNPTNCSLQGSSVLGILQARALDWTAIPPPLRSDQRLT